MIESLTEITSRFIDRGGWVIWPLVVLSVVSMTLIFERCWFWLQTNNPSRYRNLDRLSSLIRQGQKDQATALLKNDNSVYGVAIWRILNDPDSDAVVTEVIESQRNRIERFMPTLGTIITAAPMLGILGTVTGIIKTFRALGSDVAQAGIDQLAGGIAEALLTTVAGLVVALIVLFPYNAFRAQVDRTLGRIESLVMATRESNNATKNKS